MSVAMGASHVVPPRITPRSVVGEEVSVALAAVRPSRGDTLGAAARRLSTFVDVDAMSV